MSPAFLAALACTFGSQRILGARADVSRQEIPCGEADFANLPDDATMGDGQVIFLSRCRGYAATEACHAAAEHVWLGEVLTDPLVTAMNSPFCEKLRKVKAGTSFLEIGSSVDGTFIGKWWKANSNQESITLVDSPHPCWGKMDSEQQLHGEILSSICSKLHDQEANFLVFGLGRDSGFWYNNTLGKVLFLENHEDWVKFQGKAVKNVTRIVKYTTDMANYQDVLKDDAKLSEFWKSLPEEVRTTLWDVILVDSPMGMEDYFGNPKAGFPGRMQSVYAASKLANTGTTIYVDDYHRHVEQASVKELLLSREWRVNKVRSNGHNSELGVTGQTVELLHESAM